MGDGEAMMPDALANLEFRIRPRAPKTPELPQCDAAFDHESYADHYQKSRAKKVHAKGWDVNRCNREGIYRVGSKCLCAAHAAYTILHLLEEGKITLVGDLP